MAAKKAADRLREGKKLEATKPLTGHLSKKR